MLRKMMLAGVAAMVMLAGQAMAAEVRTEGTVSARLWGAADQESDYADAIELGKILGLGDYAPTWEIKPGESATFGLYVNLGTAFPGWISYLSTGGQVGFEFESVNTNDMPGLKWSVGWDSTCTITPTEENSIWKNNDFLFRNAALNDQRNVEFFTQDGSTLVMGAVGDGDNPFFGYLPSIAASAQGTKGYLLGVFTVSVAADSAWSNNTLITFGIADNGDILEGTDNMFNNQQIVLSLAPNQNGLMTVVTPEPATYAMFCGLGLVGAAWYRRNRRKA